MILAKRPRRYDYEGGFWKFVKHFLESSKWVNKVWVTIIFIELNKIIIIIICRARTHARTHFEKAFGTNPLKKKIPHANAREHFTLNLKKKKRNGEE